MDENKPKVIESQKDEKNSNQNLEECFVIMPISNQDGYESGHFNFVYEDIFKPAILKAGFKPYRADDSKSSSVIHVEIIKRLIEAPMAICDLSAKNPNVLYELGIRQAFDKPVVLVGDDDPSKIFDIGNINTHIYGKNLNYRNVLSDQKKITDMIKETYTSHENGTEMNSLISILKMNSALNNYEKKTDLKDVDLLKMMYKEITTLKDDIKKVTIPEHASDIVSTIQIPNKSMTSKDGFYRIKCEKADIDESREFGIYSNVAIKNLIEEIREYLHANKFTITNSRKRELNNMKQTLEQYLKEL